MLSKLHAFLVICAVLLASVPPAHTRPASHKRQNAFVGYFEVAAACTDALGEGTCREYARSSMCNTGLCLLLPLCADQAYVGLCETLLTARRLHTL